MTPSRELTRKEIAELFNQYQEEGGARVRWSEEVQGWMTYEGDRYPNGDVEDVARGILRDRSKE